MNMRIDVLQVPANLANREFDDLVKSGNLKLNQYKTYVRSIFLQGILLKSIDDLPRKMSGLHKLILTINDEAKKLGAKPVEVCMAYAKQIQWATGIIIGARNLVDLQDLYNTFCDNLTLSERFLETLPRVVNSLYDPRCW
jgi:aryl-alcohol dehydrogenase-like predicted oxidoreductase